MYVSQERRQRCTSPSKWLRGRTCARNWHGLRREAAFAVAARVKVYCVLICTPNPGDFSEWSSAQGGRSKFLYRKGRTLWLKRYIGSSETRVSDCNAEQVFTSSNFRAQILSQPSVKHLVTNHSKSETPGSSFSYIEYNAFTCHRC